MTAKELFISVVGVDPDNFTNSIEDCMIEFAKMKVKEALEAASREAFIDDFTGTIDRDSISNAFDLTNIK